MFLEASEVSMFLPKRRLFQVALLSLATCALLLLVGCPQEGDSRQAKKDKKTAEKALTDSEKMSEVPGKRIAAAEKGGEAKPLADWIAQLQDKDAQKRREAASALASGGKSAIPALGEVLLNDKDTEVRKTAADALWMIGKLGVESESIVPILRVALLKDKDAEVRQKAAFALIGFGKSAVPALEEALFTDKDAEVRQHAANALGKIGEPGVPSLFKAAKSQDAKTRRLVLTVASYIDKDIRRKIVPAVARFLKEEDTSFRRDAASFLGSMGDGAGEALPALLEASKPDDSAGLAARYALTRPCKAPRAIAPALRHFLKDPEPRIRLKAAEVLCGMEEGDKECLACALELIKRRDSQIREGAARLLSKYGSAAKDAVPALIEIVRNDKGVWGTRIQAINALVAIGPDAKAAIPVLKAMQDDPQIGSWAKPALKKIER